MREETFFVTYSFSGKVRADMAALGFGLAETKPVAFRRGMKVISEAYRPGYGNESIYEMRFTIDETRFEMNKERIEDYLTLLNERFHPVTRYKFCIPIIIAGSVVFAYTGLILLWILTLPGGPTTNGGWAYFVYVITFGTTNDLQGVTTVLIVLMGLTAAIGLGAAIAFAIVLAKRRKRSKQVIRHNEELEEKRRRPII